MNEYPKWKDLSKEDQEYLKEKYPQLAMDMIFGLPFNLDSVLPINWDEILSK